MSLQRFSPTRTFAVLGVLLGGALAASPASAVIVFSDDFESYAPNANVFGGSSVWHSIDTTSGTIKARTDTGLIFGPGNQYMEYEDNSTNPGGNHPEMSASFTPIVGRAARLSFDFYEPSAVPTPGYRVALANDSNNDNTSGSGERTIELIVGGQTIQQGSGVPGPGTNFVVTNAYALNTKNHIDVIANYGNETYTYSLGDVVNGTVAPKTIDILLNGELLNTEYDLDFRGESMHAMVDLIHIYTDNNGTARGFIDNLEVRSSAPFVTIDRTSGNVSLTGDWGGPIEDIIGYTITSAAGTLDAGEWQRIPAGNDDWTEVIGPEPGERLSEAVAEGVFTSYTLGQDGTLDFGNVWFRHHEEDIEFSLLIDDGTEDGLVVPVAVSYVPGAEGLGQLVEGDLNFDGEVDVFDAERFAEYGFTELEGNVPGATYTFGDMNGDLVSDYQDLILFRQAYDAANGAGAFASLTSAAAVPEPSTLLLGGFALCGALAVRRRRAIKATALCGALLACVALLPSAHAVIVFDEDFNDITPGTLIDDDTDSEFTEFVGETGTPNDASVLADTGNLFGEGASNNYLRYEDGRDNGDTRLTGPANLSGTNVFQLNFDFHDPGTATDNQDIRIGLSDAGASGASTTLDFQFRQSYFHYRGTNPPDGSLGNYTVNYNTGQTYGVVGLGNTGSTPVIYNNGDDWIAPGTFDVWVDGVKVSDNVPLPAGRPPTTHLTIHSTNASTGDMYFDNIEVHNTIDAYTYQGDPKLTLEVNTVTGQVSIKNPYNLGFDLGLDHYRITGADGALNPSGWTSLDDQEGADGPGVGWIEGGGSDDGALLWEFTNDDTETNVSFGAGLDLGTAFNTASGAGESLMFTYALNNGPEINGLVKLVTESSAFYGDFNNDGTVDAADYTVWRNNLGGSEAALGGNGNGNGVVDELDYNLWKQYFGETAPGALNLTSAQVPEPSSFALLGVAACGIFYFFRRQRSLVRVTA